MNNLWQELKRRNVIKGFKEAIIKDSINPYFHTFLGKAYKGVFNDNKNYAKYCKKAYENTASAYNLEFYFYSLLENMKFEDAHILLQSDNFKSMFNDREQQNYSFYYQYYLGDYKKANEIAEDSLMRTDYFEKPKFMHN